MLIGFKKVVDRSYDYTGPSKLKVEEDVYYVDTSRVISVRKHKVGERDLMENKQFFLENGEQLTTIVTETETIVVVGNSEQIVEMINSSSNKNLLKG